MSPHNAFTHTQTVIHSFSLHFCHAAVNIVQRHSTKRLISTITCKITPIIVRPSAPCATRVSKINKIWRRTYAVTKTSGSTCAMCAANAFGHKVTWCTIDIRILRSETSSATCVHRHSNRRTYCERIATPFIQKYSASNAKSVAVNLNAIIISS